MSDEEWKRATHASLTELYALSKKLWLMGSRNL